MKSDVPSEHYEQVCLVSWFENTYSGVLIFAIPNGGKRHPATAQKLKMEGVKAGVPDLYAPAFNLWIEMKRKKGGALSQAQKDMIKYLESIDHTVIIGKGFEDARKQVQEFMQSL